MNKLLRALLMTIACGAGCASETPKAGLGGKCDDTAQCDTRSGLTCRCVRRKAADEEGPELILAPGMCQASTFVCPPVDAGPGFDAGEVGPLPDTSGADGDGGMDTPADAAEVATDAAADAGDG